ncbi:exported hypothetical protein [Vibrio nigripulchritudo SFn135]|nr:exported hypothetical protein [Vibrio nigripulchritudo SFn135]
MGGQPSGSTLTIINILFMSFLFMLKTRSGTLLQRAYSRMLSVVMPGLLAIASSTAAVFDVPREKRKVRLESSDSEQTFSLVGDVGGVA